MFKHDPQNKIFRRHLPARIISIFWFVFMCIGFVQFESQLVVALNQSSLQLIQGESAIGDNELWFTGFSVIYIWGFILILGVIGSICAILIGIINFTSVVVSTQGIEYKGFGYSIFATWEDVYQIRWLPWPSLYPWQFDYLVLRQSTIKAHKLIAVLINRLGLMRRIPIGQFAWRDWRKSELGRYIFEKAPQLAKQKS